MLTGNLHKNPPNSLLDNPVLIPLLNHPSTNPQVVFEATAGSNYQSDIAIDHITYQAGVCPEKGTCDFENGICGWMNGPDDVFDWVRLGGDTSSSFTGPSVDHTCGSSCAPSQGELM